MMMIPRKNSFDLWDDFFKDPFFDSHESKVMRTDIKENDNNYDIIIDLPGYEKEDIKVAIEDGYLTVNATIDNSKDESTSKFVRRERYFGECSRSFYVGDSIKEDDKNLVIKYKTYRTN